MREVAVMYAKDPMNIDLVPDAYLDMSLAAKSRVGVDVFSLGEDSADGIEGLVPGSFAREMKEVDDGAVEFTETKLAMIMNLATVRTLREAAVHPPASAKIQGGGGIGHRPVANLYCGITFQAV